MRLTGGALRVIGGFLFMVGWVHENGPGFKKPELQMDQPETFQYRPKKTALVVPEDRWWEVFGDPEINGLVEKVLKNNPNLQQAAARILELQYQVIQTRADRFPSVGLKGGAQRQHEPESIFGPEFPSVEP